MTTPTQEEAAAKAIGKALMQRGIGPLALAKIALTAAAQIGEQPTQETIDAAKAIIEKTDQTVNRLNFLSTIERCAQVAEKYDPDLGLCKGIAAAIRKLKDEI